MRVSEARERILQVAGELFYRDGYRATGVNRIIDEAGVAKATFYSHFPSKDDLGLAWLSACGAESCPSAGEGNPREEIARLFGDLERQVESGAFRGCPFLNMLSEVADPEHPFRSAVADQQERVRSRIRAWLGADSRPEQVRVADQIFLLFLGAVSACQVFGCAWPVREARQSALDLLGERT